MEIRETFHPSRPDLVYSSIKVLLKSRLVSSSSNSTASSLRVLVSNGDCSSESIVGFHFRETLNYSIMGDRDILNSLQSEEGKESEGEMHFAVQ